MTLPSPPSQRPPASRIIGTGSAFPEKRVTNDDLSKRVETNDAWIQERTGIKERRISEPGLESETNSGLALRAAQRALEMAGLTPLDIDQILYATCTPDTIIPSTACWLQLKLGAHRAWAADLNAACSGFVYALTMADQSIRSGMAKNVLVVGADVLSAFTDWQDRSSCILFGDAAGAAVLTRAEETDRSGRTERNERTKSSERNAPSAPLENTGNPSGILAYALGSDGRLWDYFHIPAGGSRVELTPERWSERQGKMKMKGPEIFKVAVKTIADEAHALAEKSGVNPSEVDWLIPHQANLRIVEAAVRRLRFPMEKVLVNVDRYGNTSSATIPTLLDEAVRDGRIKPGQLLCLSTFGAGLTWGTLFLRW